MAGEYNAYAVTPSDTVPDPNGPFTELVVGGAGTLTLITVGGATVEYTVVAAQRIQLRVSQIKVTGTTATGVVGQK